MKNYVLVGMIDESNVYDLINQTNIKIYGSLEEARQGLKTEVNKVLMNIMNISFKNGILDEVDIDGSIKVTQNDENFVTVYDIKEDCHYNYFIKEV